MGLRRRPKRMGPPEREGGKAVLLILLMVGLVLGGGYVAAYAGADGRLPSGTTVAGVHVGGRTPQAAERALAAAFAPRLARPLSVTVGTTQVPVTAAEAGISVDYVASVQQAEGPRSWGASHLWDYYTGGGAHAPVVTVDKVAMDALLDQLDQKAGSPPRDGAISLADGTLQVTQPRNGATVARAEAERTLVRAWTQQLGAVSLPLQLTAPTIDQADLQTAITQLANPALSGPVTLVFHHSRVVLTPHDYAPMLTITPKNGALALDVVRTDLASLVDPASHDTAPVDASVGMHAGAPRVVPAQAGQDYGDRDVAKAFLAGVDASGDQRTVHVQGKGTPASYTTHDATKLGVTDLVSSFGVKAPGNAGPSLQAAAAKLSGVLLKPGDTFSFDASVGATSGSASRLATAAWNAAFLAGLTDVSRTAPPTASAALPPGRDAFVDASHDLQVRNDTDHGVLLDARVAEGQVTVDAWSTKEWDVAASTGAPYAVVPRPVVTDTSPTCVAVPGADGYSVDLTRTWSKAGDPTPARTDTVTTTYQPQPATVCAAAPPPPTTTPPPA